MYIQVLCLRNPWWGKVGAGTWSGPIWRADRNKLANTTFPCQGMRYKTIFFNVDYITTARNLAKSPSEQFLFREESC
jgi:hypothetical protein